MISIPGSGGLHESENAEIKPLSGRLSAIGCLPYWEKYIGMDQTIWRSVVLSGGTLSIRRL